MDLSGQDPEGHPALLSGSHSLAISWHPPLFTEVSNTGFKVLTCSITG